MSEKIPRQHLGRKAVLSVRQSSADQGSHNVESQALPYAMQGRLQQLGWREIEVVDDDLGRSAAGMVTRTGFERMVAEVCLGKVGAVAAREVSRFARNNRDWQPLVEVCRVVDTVLIDQDTVDAPRHSNDRWLLGLKGSLNEYELDLLRQRSVDARRAKARRGELIVASPAGYLKTEAGRLEKDPDRRVQEAVRRVFAKFVELGTVRQTLLWFLEHGLQVPVRTAPGEIRWTRPAYDTLYRMLTNPVYGGAYAYGKTEQVPRDTPGGPRPSYRRKPGATWLALLPNAHDGYVTWAQFEQIPTAISENVARREQGGAVQRGVALMAGRVRCHRCGQKLTVRSTGRQHDVRRYACHRGWLDTGVPRCMAFGGVPVDHAIADEILRVVHPAAREAAVVASDEDAHRQDDVVAALQRDLEAARYAARRAQKQDDAADPDNRLVADELERRWDEALQHVREVEQQIAPQGDRQAPAPAARREECAELAADLEAVWQHPDTDARVKKRIVRTLIREVVVDVDAAAGEVILVIHWKGGVHTELRLPRRRRGENSQHTSPDIVSAVRVLAQICSDTVIAGVLNRHGLRTGRGNRWTRERVTALRSHQGIPCYDHNRRVSEGWMNLTEAATVLQVSARALRLAVERGQLAAQHPLPDGPWVFHRDALTTPMADKLVERVRQGRRHAAIPSTQQDTLRFSGT